MKRMEIEGVSINGVRLRNEGMEQADLDGLRKQTEKKNEKEEDKRNLVSQIL